MQVYIFSMHKFSHIHLLACMTNIHPHIIYEVVQQNSKGVLEAKKTMTPT